jgi:hypothetical protein
MVIRVGERGEQLRRDVPHAANFRLFIWMAIFNNFSAGNNLKRGGKNCENITNTSKTWCCKSKKYQYNGSS